MTDRRSHPRFVVGSPWDGTVRVLRDVMVQRVGPDEFVAVTLFPGRIDEEMTLDVVGGGASVGVRVKVIDSAPVIVGGAVRHRIRLSLVGLERSTAEVVPHGDVSTAADALER